jgi:hypothetical protein
MAWTFSQMQDKVLGWLDDTADVDRMRVMCQQVLNDANLARSTEYPWPFMRSTATLIMVALTRTYTLPADFYRPLYLYNTNTKQYLSEVGPRGLQELGPDPSNAPYPWGNMYGVSQPFYFSGSSITLLQDPTPGDTVTLVYYKTPVEMSANTDLPALPWPHAQVLVYDAVLDLKMYAAESTDLVGFWTRKRDDALYRLYEAYKGDQALGAWTGFVHPSEV